MTYPQVGAAIRARRETLKLSMRAAAKLGGVSPQTWSDLEVGKFPPSLATQRGVALALKWPNGWLDAIEGGAAPELLQEDDPRDELRALVESHWVVTQELVAQIAALTERVTELGDALARAQRGGRPTADGSR